jgi:hypothetical protein
LEADRPLATPSANGPLIDSTDAFIAHETMEAVTDPLLDSWINLSSQLWLGNEVADECQFVSWTLNAQTFLSVTLGSHVDALQSIHSNADHACVTEPKR